MTPERRQQVKDVLRHTLGLVPQERSAFLAQRCAADQTLRKEVESLLAADDSTRFSFLESPQALHVKNGMSADQLARKERIDAPNLYHLELAHQWSSSFTAPGANPQKPPNEAKNRITMLCVEAAA